MRRLTRALGPVRELDVALEMLETLTAEAEAPRGAIAKLRQVVREERQRMHTEMCTRVGRVDIDKLQSSGRDRRQQGRQGGRPRPQARRRSAVTRGAPGSPASRGDRERRRLYLPDRLHEVRIAVKKLRYAMEVSRELSGSRATARIRTLKEAQDLLGHMHDHEVLIARVRSVQGPSRRRTFGCPATSINSSAGSKPNAGRSHGQYMALPQEAARHCRRRCDAAFTASRAAA